MLYTLRFVLLLIHPFGMPGEEVLPALYRAALLIGAAVSSQGLDALF